MGRKITGKTRDELVGAIAERYRAGSKKTKLQVLDEFVAVTGYHRKHAIRVLSRHDGGVQRSSRRSKARVYDEAFRQALIVLWEASDRVCGKRLKALLPVLVTALEQHGHLRLDDVVRANLLAASAATIDRSLREPRAASATRRRRANARPAIRRAVPVRTFADWKEPQPGFVEADRVAHCGESMEGSFVHTLAPTDIASGWTECAPLVVREGTLVVEAVARLRSAMPFPLRGFDTDNGSEFLNVADRRTTSLTSQAPRATRAA